MLIKDLITQLQDIYDEQSKLSEVLGEPEIQIDSFKKAPNGYHTYQGFTPDIRIERSGDGVYFILSELYND